MLWHVSRPMRTLLASIVIAGAMTATSVASAATVIRDEPVGSTAPALHTSPAAHPAALHPMTAASNSTRHVAHDAVLHRRHHAHTRHAEPSLRAHVVSAASLPARVPPRPRVPRSSHRAPAPALGHRDAGSRTGGAAGLPASAASALSIAVLGTCVHQRTRDRLRSVSQPLESRGPPRAGPHATLASRDPRGARESTVGASAPHPPTGRSLHSRVIPSPASGPPHLAPPTPARDPLARPDPLHAQRMAPAAVHDARPARALRRFPVSRRTGAQGPTWSARSRAGALRCRSLDPEESR
jgi:hypothetical protein